MSTELRKKALTLVQNSVQISHRVCLVNNIAVPIYERNLLLRQLLNGEDYLLVPLSLYFRDVFWRELKVESVLQCKAKGVDNRQCQRDFSAYVKAWRESNTVVIEDKNGIPVRFSIADIIEHEHKKYYFLYEYEKKESDCGYAVFEADTENTETAFYIVEDETLLDILFAAFDERSRYRTLFSA